MKKHLTLGGAVAAFLAAPFSIAAATMDETTAVRVLLVTLLAAVSLPIAWGGTEVIAGWCAWHELPDAKRRPRKLIAPAILGALPTVVLSRHLYAWFPGSIEGVLVFAATLGAIAPFSWRWVKDHVLARAALEVGGQMKIVRDRVTGKTRAIPAAEQSGDDEETQLYVGGGATEVPPALKQDPKP